MFEFARAVFRDFMGIVLWLVLIACTILGGLIGSLGDSTFMGIVLGIIFGLITVILGGGFVATFLQMGENLDIIAKNISNVKSSSQTSGGSVSNSGSGSRVMVGRRMQKKCARCKRECDEDYSACPHCGNERFE